MMKLLLGWALMAATALVSAGEVSASGAWIRLLPGSLPGAGYVELRNEGKDPMALIRIESPAFSDIELHLSSEEDGVAHMQHVERLDLPPGETVVLAPGGYHLMMFGRSAGLTLGGLVPVTLHFPMAVGRSLSSGWPGIRRRSSNRPANRNSILTRKTVRLQPGRGLQRGAEQDFR